MDREAQLIERIRKLSHKEPPHNLADLKTLMDIQVDVYSDALKSQLILPFRQNSQELSSSLSNLIDAAKREPPEMCQPESPFPEILRMGQGEHPFLEILRRVQSGNPLSQMIGMGPAAQPPIRFSFKVYDSSFYFLLDRTPEVSSALEKVLALVDKKASMFDKLYDRLYKSMKLEVLPDPDLGKGIYLPRGHLIIPNRTDPGYHVFEFQPTKGACNNTHIGFSPTAKGPERFLRNAIARHVNTRLVGTTVVARNAERCSLYGTALPIAMEKYQKLCGYNDCEKKTSKDD